MGFSTLFSLSITKLSLYPPTRSQAKACEGHREYKYQKNPTNTQIDFAPVQLRIVLYVARVLT